MPRRKVPKRRKVIRRRSAWRAKRRGRKSTTSAIMRGPSGFPDRVVVKLKYFESLDVTLASGVSAYYEYRGNSLFDPNKTGTGHQPYGFDQWAGFYTNYRVYGSSIHLQPNFGLSAAVGTNNLCLRLVVVPFIGSFSSSNELTEMPYAKMSNVSMYNNAAGKLTSYMSSAKIFGTTKSAIRAEDGQQSATTTSPTDQWEWGLFFMGGANSGDTQYYTVDVKLTFYCEFTRRKQIGQS